MTKVRVREGLYFHLLPASGEKEVEGRTWRESMFGDVSRPLFRQRVGTGPGDLSALRGQRAGEFQGASVLFCRPVAENGMGAGELTALFKSGAVAIPTIGHRFFASRLRGISNGPSIPGRPRSWIDVVATHLF